MIAAVLSALLLTTLSPQAASASTASVPTASVQAVDAPLQQHVHNWAEALSNQPAFKAWKTAATTIVPLGPGTHGWLATFTAAGKPVGYMIVNARPEGGYALGEYGAGSHPAFDPNTMYNALLRQGLIGSYSEIAKKPLHLERLYLSPMLAAWKWTAPNAETYYLDAWTGEALPITDSAWSAQTVSRKPEAWSGEKPKAELSKLAAAKTNQSFDPFERMPWLNQAPLSNQQVAKLTGMLDKLAQIRYTAELFKSSVLYVLPAVGYHRWNNDKLFVAFEQSFPGTRYIPIEALNREGRFYR